MKRLILPFMIWHFSTVDVQVNWKETTDWKIYNPSGVSMLRIPTDSLVYLKSYSLQLDSIRQFLDTVTALARAVRPAWMGGFLASYVFRGEIRKVDVSAYGGFFYDEKSKTYFQLRVEKKDGWIKYLNECLLAIE